MAADGYLSSCRAITMRWRLPARPDLRGSHILSGCGHWVRQERADEVNRLLAIAVNSDFRGSLPREAN